jgi:hypothetical protein
MLAGANSTLAAEQMFACSLCVQSAGEVKLYGPESNAVVVRQSFTSRLEGRIEAAHFEPLRKAILARDAKALYTMDLEFAPFYCPRCDQNFCGAHWRKWDVFDEDGWHDSIGGICPRGHERMLED